VKGTRAVVAGAGLGGALIATQLARAGFDVEEVERRQDPRRTGKAEGRSINLALSTRGLHALDQVGLKQAILSIAIPMRGRRMHALDGTLTFQPYGTEAHQQIWSMSRGVLNQTLVEAAEAAGARVRFGQRVTWVDAADGVVHLEDSLTGSATSAQGDLVVGADGAFSAVRSTLQRGDRFVYSQTYLAHGYKELSIPTGPRGSFALDPHALHIWPRGGFMMIALPNQEGSFTCTLFLAFQGDPSFARLEREEDVRRFFETTFPDAVPLMPTLLEDFFANPTSSLVTVRCRPWHQGKVVLLGDAAHAVVPFYGQGANASFEDCVVLDACLKRHAPDWAAAFAAYEEIRKRHADALADLAIGNFIEMRDKVASRAFLLRKKTEKLLHKALPWWYVPLYSMVSFSRTPYADAVDKAARQDRIVLAVAAAALLVLVATLAWWLT
jgi:kynurenine 3-monooxygenase